MDIEDLRTKDADQFCESCKLGKSLRTVSCKPQIRSEKVFDMVHVDIIRPITPTGFNRHK